MTTTDDEVLGSGLLSPQQSSDRPAEMSLDNAPVRPAALAPAELDHLVDQVVERIEQRVVDELERRGRRHNPGVF